jgi:small subunit ribosomal protein S9
MLRNQKCWILVHLTEKTHLTKMSEDKETKLQTNNSSIPVDLSDENKPKLDNLGRAYATGRRKTSVSRVWIKYGQPKIVVNGKPVEKYFLRKIYTSILEAPLSKTDNLDKIEILSTVSGGGLSGQAGAIRHGISRALVNLEPSLRKKLKKMGFLTRDARKVERKKFGKHKARRSPQFSKR